MMFGWLKIFSRVSKLESDNIKLRDDLRIITVNHSDLQSDFVLICDKIIELSELINQNKSEVVIKHLISNGISDWGDLDVNPDLDVN